MINRRILRIKTMQSLYAFKVLKEANFELSKEYLATLFEPNYMAKVPEDKSLLRKEEKTAQTLFKNWILNNEISIKDDSVKITDSVNKAIKHYSDLIDNDFKKLKKKLVLEIEQIYDKYILILNIIENLQLISGSQIGQDDNNFFHNKAITILSGNTEYDLQKTNRGIQWKEDIAQLRKFFRDDILPSEQFATYQSISNPTLEEDKEIVLQILRKFVFEDESLSSILEENDLYWIENKNILKGMIKKTIKSIGSEDDSLLLALSSNWEDDKDFINILFDKSIKIEKETIGEISNRAKNWDSERLAMTDIIIINLGITEMIYFPNIPVKVTINEFIEISKSYSTPKSKQFINGLLDSISKDYISSGKIKKSGRGLIDTNF